MRERKLGVNDELTDHDLVLDRIICCSVQNFGELVMRHVFRDLIRRYRVHHSVPHCVVLSI